MLQAIGLDRMEDLFSNLPAAGRFPALDLPPAASQIEVAAEMRGLAGRNASLDRHVSFLGAGVYDHCRPATVDSVLQRAEFFTSYTPYQAELSQGMLQAMFEYQSMICRLTGMEVSNASHYDGATSLAEAVLMALAVAVGKRRKVVVSPAVHPQYRQVLRTYLRGAGAAVTGDAGALTSPIGGLIDAETAAVVVQDPNFFGQFEDAPLLADLSRRAGALFIVVVDPVALGLFRPPGAYGADVAVADGQSLGIPPSFGGPHLGIFATKRVYLRRVAGRLVGETTDARGRRGYVLTLGTREQHIRRARATSNICTNSALGALAASVHLATLGRKGLRRAAELCYYRSHYAAREIARQPGMAVNPQAPHRPFFKEFVVRLSRPVAEVNRALFEDWGIVGGYDLAQDFPQFANHALIAVTETKAKADIDRLIEALRATAG